MDELLFDGFPEVSAKMWKQKIQFDLKGTDYNTLVWSTPEGINVKPFYNAEDTTPLPPPEPLAARWKIAQGIFVAHEKKAGIKAADAIDRGAESIWFTLPPEKHGLPELLDEIDLSVVPVYMDPRFLSPAYIRKLGEYTASSPGSGNIRILTDIIGNLARQGNWFHDIKKDHEALKDICSLSGNFGSVIAVDTTLYQNAGATIVQQLAYALAHANEYLNFMDSHGLISSLGQQQMVFKTAVGTNYFFEIAKLRALRILWATLATEYGVCPQCHILAQPTRRNKTLYDYNLNMLRTTTENMSAILGGADTIASLPYDVIYHKDNEFAERIARNQLLILKHESYLDKTANAADGTYYIESLTGQFAEKALDIFKQIEAGGGFLKQLKDHVIQKKIKESAQAEQQHFDEGREVLVGTNKYPNPKDRMKDSLERYPFVKTHPRKTLIAPIIEKRLSEQTEQNRLEQETVIK